MEETKGQVIFLNSWLNCPHEKKHEHQLIQDKINSRRIKIYQDNKHSNFQITVAYMLFLKYMKSKIKLSDPA